jgi:hypothetical protein
MSGKEVLQKWPSLYLNNIVVRFFLKRYVALFFCIIIFFSSYILSSYNESHTFITGSGSVVSIIGLLLTLKHNFISEASEPKVACFKFHHKMGSFNSIHQMKDPEYVNPVISAIRDEYLGILMVIIGGLVSGYGSFIPIINIRM